MKKIAIVGLVASAALQVAAALSVVATVEYAQAEPKQRPRTGGPWHEPIYKEPRKRAQWKDESNRKGRNR